MIEFYQLEQLTTIAKEGTISKAADSMMISQPALTRSIQRLEKSLGMQLFERKKNKVTLNDNGKMAVSLAIEILDKKESMIQTLQAYHRSKYIISIGSCAPAPIWKLTSFLKIQYPDMKLTDTLNPNETSLLEGLHNHQYSLIVLTHPIEKKDYFSIELFEEKLFLSVPPAHPLALCKEISFDNLDGESVLLLSQIGFWNEICLKMIPNSHLLVQEDHTVFDELTKLSALPYFKSNITILLDKEQDKRVNIPIIDKEAHVKYYAIYHKSNNQLFEFLKHKF
ncbi:MAG: LysR family transcriptional regulator [Coprobacillaceae bacterium]